jgi:hypothetical protein
MNNRITIRPKRRPLIPGQIYLIKCKSVPIYIGKTINMENRWKIHKSDKKQTMKKHMAEFGFQLHDYSYEILETLSIVGKYDSKLSQAEGKHYHYFTEQGYELINGNTPNNGDAKDHNSLSYANHIANMRARNPCELCGIVGTHVNKARHRKTDECKKGRESYSYILMYEFVINLTN